MKQLNKEEIRREELALLDTFSTFCEKNSLRFFLCGGSLLGAIRHGGFIPWDDDIDLCMPRSDFDMFVKKFKSSENCFLLSFNSEKKLPFVKLVNKKILVSSKYSFFDEHLWIDIFPVDGVPSGKFLNLVLFSTVKALRRLYLCKFAKRGEGKTRARQIGKAILKTLLFIPPNYIGWIINKIQLMCSYNSASQVAIVGWGLYGVGEAMTKEKFEKSTLVQFEGRKVPAFSCWDEYLSNLYGDYMQVPPLEKRTNHSFKAYYRS